MNPFATHAAAFESYEKILGDGNATGCATLKIFNTEIPCTHTGIVSGFDFVSGGTSSTTMVQQCEFRADQLPRGNVPRRGISCQLRLRPDLAPVPMKLWSGGLEPGGYIYRFMLVDANYNA